MKAREGTLTWSGAAVLGAIISACGGSSTHSFDAATPDAGWSTPDRSQPIDDGTSRSNSQPDVPRLRTNVPPGGNFDLSLWELQEPVGSPGSPTVIRPTALVGEAGYQDNYFFTDPDDGAMTFWAPENGVTTPNSNYPRSELREMNADHSEANWPLAGTNTLSATVAVTRVPDHVCVGQIHCGTPLDASVPPTTKPLVELYYYANGDVKLGIEKDPSGGQSSYAIGNIPLGTAFSYVIALSGDGTLIVTINGVPHTFAVPATFNGYGEYFKAGNYDQTSGTDPTVGAIVKFYALAVAHGP